MAVILEVIDRKREIIGTVVVNEELLKMEDRAGIDLCKWEGEIRVKHRYCTGNFVSEKNE